MWNESRDKEGGGRECGLREVYVGKCGWKAKWREVKGRRKKWRRKIKKDRRSGGK